MKEIRPPWVAMGGDAHLRSPSTSRHGSMIYHQGAGQVNAVDIDGKIMLVHNI